MAAYRLGNIFLRNKREFIASLVVFIIFLCVIPIFTYLYFSRDIASKEKIMNRNDTGVTLYDANNKPFFTFYQAKRRSTITESGIPDSLKNAIIASEDKDFYRHPGFSPKAILRSFLLNVREREIGYGGSTITQQLVKNALLSPKKSFLRKYQELILAQEIERRYSKNEILTMYLNSVYFGEGAFGIEDASNTFFGKSAKELTIAEASMLAAILPAPSKLSPLSGDLAEAKNRQKIVLGKMQQLGYITEQERNNALKTKLIFNPIKNSVNSKAPHFALMVRDELIRKYGEEYISRSGFRVYTTLNLSWQTYAENIVANQVKALAGNRVSNAAAVAVDPGTGEVPILVGSYNWHDNIFGKVNVVTSLRQPGSSFKPIMYITGFERHILTPATLLHDVPTTYKTPVGDYRPLDFDRNYRGNVLLRRALANSLNIPAVEAITKVGIEPVLSMASRLGITTLKDASNYGPSLALGSGEVKLIELTHAYAIFASQGVDHPIHFIKSIHDKNNSVIYEYKKRPITVIDPAYTYLISSILSDNVTRAETFGNVLTIPQTAAVKTGTTEDFRDALTIGYTPSIAVGVWVGNNDNTPMDSIAGSLGAAPIWKMLMQYFLKDLPNEQFTIPPNIITATICKGNGLLAKESTSSAINEYFVVGTEPKQLCNSDQKKSENSQSSSKNPSAAITAAPTESITPTPKITLNPTSNPTSSEILQILQTPTILPSQIKQKDKD